MAVVAVGRALYFGVPRELAFSPNTTWHVDLKHGTQRRRTAPHSHDRRSHMCGGTVRPRHRSGRREHAFDANVELHVVVRWRRAPRSTSCTATNSRHCHHTRLSRTQMPWPTPWGVGQAADGGVMAMEAVWRCVRCVIPPAPQNRGPASVARHCQWGVLHGSQRRGSSLHRHEWRSHTCGVAVRPRLTPLLAVPRWRWRIHAAFGTAAVLLCKTSSARSLKQPSASPTQATHRPPPTLPASMTRTADRTVGVPH